MIKSVLRLTNFSLAKTENVRINQLARLTCLKWTHPRCIHLTSSTSKEIRLDRSKVKVGTTKFGLLDGEQTVSIDSPAEQKQLFPDEDTPNSIFDGILYKELPVINIKVSPNNTIMTLVDHLGNTLLLYSAGIEGYKNAKKGTNIAAQHTAVTVGIRSMEKGVRTVKVRVQGIGPGRMSAIKGLHMSGLNVVSITDDTRVSWNPPRPRKPRKI